MGFPWDCQAPMGIPWVGMGLRFFPMGAPLWDMGPGPSPMGFPCRCLVTTIATPLPYTVLLYYSR